MNQLDFPSNVNVLTFVVEFESRSQGAFVFISQTNTRNVLVHQ